MCKCSNKVYNIQCHRLHIPGVLIVSCVCFSEQEPDYNWTLMKLMANFPDCNKVFLEDILNQCNYNYEQAYELLICSLS